MYLVYIPGTQMGPLVVFYWSLGLVLEVFFRGTVHPVLRSQGPDAKAKGYGDLERSDQPGRGGSCGESLLFGDDKYAQLHI